MAINLAMQEVKKSGDLPVPLHLRNAPTKLMKELGYGEEYKYSHDFDNHFVAQEFLPNEISGTTFYNPSEYSRERDLKEFLKDNNYDGVMNTADYKFKGKALIKLNSGVSHFNKSKIKCYLGRENYQFQATFNNGKMVMGSTKKNLGLDSSIHL